MTNNQHSSLADQIAELRVGLASHLSPEALAVLDAGAEAAGRTMFDRAVTVGHEAPDFTLPDANGAKVSLKERLAEGPVVLVFYRGAWCPYCNLQLRAYQQHLDQFAERGARLLAVSPQTPDKSMTFAETAELGFDVLSDEGGHVVARYGLVFEVDAASREVMQGIGIDLADHNGEGTWRLPVPATYVVGQDGEIIFAAVDGDYRRRAEPADLLAALDGR
jgi:peroxiredoxin